MGLDGQKDKGLFVKLAGLGRKAAQRALHLFELRTPFGSVSVAIMRSCSSEPAISQPHLDQIRTGSHGEEFDIRPCDPAVCQGGVAPAAVTLQRRPRAVSLPSRPGGPERLFSTRPNASGAIS